MLSEAADSSCSRTSHLGISVSYRGPALLPFATEDKISDLRVYLHVDAGGSKVSHLKASSERGFTSHLYLTLTYSPQCHYTDKP